MEIDDLEDIEEINEEKQGVESVEGDFYNPDLNAPVGIDKPTPAPENAQVTTLLAPPSIIQQATATASRQVESSIDRATDLLDASGVNEELKAVGIGGVNKENIKKLLLAYATFQIIRKMKSNIKPVLAFSVAGYLYLNRNKFFKDMM